MAHHLFSSSGSRKALSALLLFTLLFSCLPVMVQPVSATVLEYSRNYTVPQLAGAGTGYPVHIKVYASSGNTSGSSVYLDGKCRDDFGDLRFYDDDGVTQLDYALTNVTSGVSADVWVKLNDNLSSGDVTFTMLYGNLSMTSQSNTSAVFLFYDDFESGSIDTSKWTVVGSPYVTAVNGRNWVRLQSSTWGGQQLTSKGLTADNYTLYACMRYAYYNPTSYGPRFFFYIRGGAVYMMHECYQDGSGWSGLVLRKGTTTLDVERPAWSMNVDYPFVFRTSANWNEFTINGKTLNSNTYAPGSGNFFFGTWDNDVVLVDYVYAVPYTATDPSPGEWSDLRVLYDGAYMITIGPFTITSFKAFNTTAYAPANGTWNAAAGELIFSPGVADVNITADRFPSTVIFYTVVWWDSPLDMSTVEEGTAQRIGASYDLLQIPAFWHSGSGAGYYIIVRFITMQLATGASQMGISEGDASFAGYTDTDGTLTLTGCGDIVLSSAGLPSGDFFITVNGHTWDDWAWNGSYIWIYDVPCSDAAIVVDFSLQGETPHCTNCGGNGDTVPQGDNDGDGLKDNVDPDDDNDGIPDGEDERPFNWDPLPDNNANDTTPPANDTVPAQQDFNSAVDSAFGFVPAEVRPVVVFTVVGLPVIFILLLIVGGGATAKGTTYARRGGR
jgi:hypothetical protein